MPTNLSREQSIALIRETILTAKNDRHPRDSFLLLWWGYWLLFASAGHYLLRFTPLAGYAFHTWWLMAIGVIGSVVFSIRQRPHRHVKTFFDGVLGYVWISVSVGLAITGLFALQLRQHAFPVILLLYGIGLFTTGGTVKFRPLLLGGVACWLLAIGSFMAGFSGQLLLLATAALLGFILPGHVLLVKARTHVQ